MHSVKFSEFSGLELYKDMSLCNFLHPSLFLLGSRGRSCQPTEPDHARELQRIRFSELSGLELFKNTSLCNFLIGRQRMRGCGSSSGCVDYPHVVSYVCFVVVLSWSWSCRPGGRRAERQANRCVGRQRMRGCGSGLGCVDYPHGVSYVCVVVVLPLSWSCRTAGR